MTNPVIIGNARLYLGDCREILPTLPSHDSRTLRIRSSSIGLSSHESSP